MSRSESSPDSSGKSATSGDKTTGVPHRITHENPRVQKQLDIAAGKQAAQKTTKTMNTSKTTTKIKKKSKGELGESTPKRDTTDLMVHTGGRVIRGERGSDSDGEDIHRGGTRYERDR